MRENLARQKHDNYDWVILLLLLLGFKLPPGLGGTGGTGGSMGEATATRTGTGKPNTSNDSGVDTSGSTTKSRPNTDPTGGVNDKSKDMSAPGGATPRDNAGVTFAQKVTSFIMGSTPTARQGGLNLIPDLPTVGGTGGESSTTAIYNPTTGKYEYFTNNQYLFASSSTSKPSGPTMMEMVKKMVQPVIGRFISTPDAPTQKIPVDIPYPKPVILQVSGNIESMIMAKNNPQGLIDITTSNAKAKPSETMPPSNLDIITKIQNPLQQQSNLLSEITSGFTNFGQEALNKFLGIFTGPPTPLFRPTITPEIGV